MSANTKIEWADHTFNPWEGCQKVGPGCDNCYAEARNARFAGGQAVNWGPGALRRRTSEANWHQPLRWNAEAARLGIRYRVFCASLADVFDNEVDPQWRDELFGLIAATPNLDWLVLTKRIGNALAYLTDPATPRRVETMKHVVLAGRLEERHAAERTADIKNWPGYFITSKGRVLSDRTNAGRRGPERHELKLQAGEAGHARVMLQVEGQTERPLVHRLVLAAFDRQPRDDEQGCHIDGDASNNALWNLRWGDQTSNWSDSKRHGTRRRYSKLSPAQVKAMRTRAAAGETAAALAPEFGISDTQVRNILRGDQWKPEATMEWPLPWVWLGATIVNQEEADRDIPKLLAVPAAKRFLSMEPLLGQADVSWAFPDIRTASCHRCGFRTNSVGGTCPNDGQTLRGDVGVDWVIVGGESGHGARPAQLQWFRSIVRQCRAAGVPVLVKQLGREVLDDGMSSPGEHWPPTIVRRQMPRINEADPGFVVRLQHAKGGDPSEWPEDLRIREFP